MAVIVVLAAACGSDAELYGTVVEKQTLEIGGMEAALSLGRGQQRVELLVPANALPTRTQVRVSLVSGVARRGRHPAVDTAVLIEPRALTFSAPVRMRQLVPPAPVGRRYRTVVVPEGASAFAVRGPARLLARATPETLGLEVWEGDSEGSGLWGLSLEEPGDGLVAEVPDASASERPADAAPAIDDKPIATPPDAGAPPTYADAGQISTPDDSTGSGGSAGEVRVDAGMNGEGGSLGTGGADGNGGAGGSGGSTEPNYDAGTGGSGGTGGTDDTDIRYDAGSGGTGGFGGTAEVYDASVGGTGGL